jgi:phospholipid transport system substrate-binding protein
MEVVKSAQETAHVVLNAPKPKLDQLSAPADEVFDFRELTRRSLGAYWNQLTALQQDDIAGTMRGLLRATVGRELGNGKPSDTRLEWGQETLTGDEAKVTSTLFVPGEKLAIEYRLHNANARWRIYDVITDEVSLVETYQAQFKKVIAQKGFDGLLKTLKAKQAKLEKAHA